MYKMSYSSKGCYFDIRMASATRMMLSTVLMEYMYMGQGVTRLVYHPAIALIWDGMGNNNSNDNRSSLVTWPEWT
jgi:hypothetical protein